MRTLDDRHAVTLKKLAEAEGALAKVERGRSTWVLVVSVVGEGAAGGGVAGLIVHYAP